MTSVAQAGPRVRRRTPTDEWNAVAEEWLEHVPHNLWRKHSDAVNAILVDRWLPYGMLDRVLKTDLFDEAVTSGLYPVLTRHASSVAALDVSAAIISAAVARYPKLKPYAADVRALPFEPDAFDAIVSNSTLDHFETKADIDAALKELYRVLKPGGTLILTLDNAANPIIAVRNSIPYRLTHAARLVPYPVGKTLGPSSSSKAAISAGFEVLETTTVMHAPRVLAIPLMNAAERWGRPSLANFLLRLAMWFEKLGTLPTRGATGHFVAIRARKPLH
jgi:SAM-dependent methyltransferase